MYHFGCQLENFGYLSSKNHSQKPLVDNQNDILMYFCAMSHKAKYAQVLF